jgi:hypothetical protein
MKKPGRKAGLFCCPRVSGRSAEYERDALQMNDHAAANVADVALDQESARCYLGFDRGAPCASPRLAGRPLSVG